MRRTDDPTAPPSDGEIEVRPARPDDAREVAELWCAAFPGRRAVEDRVRMLEVGGRYGGLETVMVARDRDGLAGALKLYRMEQHLDGVAFPMMGLAAVAVEPSRRRRGLGARLCTHAIGVAAERGDLVSVLYPFRPDYYERLGWGLVGGFEEYRFRTETLEAYPEGRAVRVAEPVDRDAIEACYRRVAARSNGPMVRDSTAWSYRLADQDLGVRPVRASAFPDPSGRGEALVYDDDGIRGYALLHFAESRGGEPRLDVRELVADDDAAYRGLLGAIRARAERWPRTRHFARPEERFGDRLRDPRPPGHRNVRSLSFATGRIIRGPMLRVLDVPGALERRRWNGRHNEPFVLRVGVRDPQRPENGGPWRVEIGPDGGAVRPGADGTVDATLQTDAATFARIFVGELGPAAAAALGRARVGGDADRLERVFETRERFWLLDEF